MKTSHLAVLALALTGFSSQAMAWGADGHRAVAAIAIKLLPPDRAQAAENLLSNSDLDRGFVDAASYADEVIRERDHRHVFSPWHFVDWPADTPAYSDSFCTPDCIVNELPKQIEAMRTSTDMEAKALAMSWVIHLMGDLHQPMHVTDRGDRGQRAGIDKIPCFLSKDRFTQGLLATLVADTAPVLRGTAFGMSI